MKASLNLLQCAEEDGSIKRSIDDEVQVMQNLIQNFSNVIKVMEHRDQTQSAKITALEKKLSWLEHAVVDARMDVFTFHAEILGLKLEDSDSHGGIMVAVDILQGSQADAMGVPREIPREVPAICCQRIQPIEKVVRCGPTVLLTSASAQST